MLQILLERGANIEAKDDAGLTALDKGLHLILRMFYIKFFIPFL